MIQIDVAIHTNHGGQDGLVIPAGSVLDVIPYHPSQRLYDQDTGDCIGIQHDVNFNVVIYKSLTDFEAGGDPLLTEEQEIREFNIKYSEKNVDPSSLSSLAVQTFLKDHIENGDSVYPGIGASNAQIVYPSWA